MFPYGHVHRKQFSSASSVLPPFFECRPTRLRPNQGKASTLLAPSVGLKNTSTQPLVRIRVCGSHEDETFG
ncbi:hypothetical protein Taro_052940 [Colocasia esculenta]|uniref:Uncharacterized protein n=1 Tax=Colocasia esculenta TaxID=4460 RepID=A0A843XLP3_COLES|nr:hypothetical protein [Colocasia esculenta]